MTKRRLESTFTTPLNLAPSDPLEIKFHAGVILSPVGHALVVAVAVALLVFMGFTAGSVFVWIQGGRAMNELSALLFAILGVMAGVVTYLIVYIRRDSWLRNHMEPPRLDKLGLVMTVPDTLSDQYIPIRQGTIARLQIPEEWGLTDEMFIRLGRRVADGDLVWSRRHQADIIPEERYTDLSELLLKRGLLQRAPNNSYRYTQAGVGWLKNLAVGGGGTLTDY